jgi:hypothetical protein
MLRTFRLLAALVAFAFVAAALLPPLVAHAHEHRTVGDYEFIVGWMVEPAFAGQKNGLDLRINRIVEQSSGAAPSDQTGAAGQPPTTAEQPAATAGTSVAEVTSGTASTPTPEPVPDLEDSLKVEVIYGASTKALELRGVYGRPGAYTADVVPTRPGDYRFHVFGEIDGQPIDETFDSADGHFSAVEEIKGIEFPAAASDTAGLAEPVAAPSAASSEEGSPSSTAGGSNLGLAALGVAALAFLLSASTLLSARRRP